MQGCRKVFNCSCVVTKTTLWLSSKKLSKSSALTTKKFSPCSSLRVGQDMCTETYGRKDNYQILFLPGCKAVNSLCETMMECMAVMTLFDRKMLCQQLWISFILHPWLCWQISPGWLSKEVLILSAETNETVQDTFAMYGRMYRAARLYSLINTWFGHSGMDTYLFSDMFRKSHSSKMKIIVISTYLLINN